jgi:hypothetical protein
LDAKTSNFASKFPRMSASGIHCWTNNASEPATDPIRNGEDQLRPYLDIELDLMSNARLAPPLGILLDSTQAENAVERLRSF